MSHALGSQSEMNTPIHNPVESQQNPLINSCESVSKDFRQIDTIGFNALSATAHYPSSTVVRNEPLLAFQLIQRSSDEKRTLLNSQDDFESDDEEADIGLVNASDKIIQCPAAASSNTPPTAKTESQ